MIKVNNKNAKELAQRSKSRAEQRCLYSLNQDSREIAGNRRCYLMQIYVR